MFWWNGLKSFKKKILLIRGMFFFSVDINFVIIFQNSWYDCRDSLLVLEYIQ